VIVAVKAASLNYHDVFTRRGMPGIKVPMPAIMGLDVAGEIAEVGPGVTGWKKGRSASWSIPSTASRAA
jgi:alcohol dehydrogenase